MLRCVLISSDIRLVTQVRTWVKPLEDNLRFDVFANFEELKAYRNIAVDGHRTEAFEKDIAGGPDAKTIRLLVVDIDVILQKEQKPIQAIQELQALVKEMELAPKLGASRVLLLAHDGGAYKLEALQHEAIDDVVLKPLDRQLFLQKMEILSSDDPKIKPTFLFQAKTDMLIEVGKDIVVDEISEFGVSMRNPGPLNPGLFAAIHLDVFGKGGQGRVIGRVYGSNRHPIRQGEYIVHFSFFGLTADQLMSLRLFVKSQQTTMKIPKSAASNSKAARLLIEEEPVPKKFAVIDMNPQSLHEVIDILESGYRDVAVKPFTSYSRLQAELLKLIAANNVVPGSPAAAAQEAGKADGGASKDKAFPSDKLFARVRGGGSYELMGFDPKPGKGEIILGRSAEDWAARPDLFFASIEKEDKELVTELLAYTEKGVKGKGAFRMVDFNGKTVYIEASGALEKVGEADGPATLRLEMKQIDAEKFGELNGESGADRGSEKGGSFYRFDAIFIDAALVRPSPDEWYQSFTTILRKSGALGENDTPPKIIIMGDDRTSARPETYRLPGIHDFTRKPLDRRLILLKTQALIKDLKLARELDTPPQVPVELAGKLAKEVKLTEASEFGIVVEQKSPFREKILMRFFSPLFGADGGTWVTARCLYCQKAGDGDLYNCSFMFFGSSDDVLQRIRRWIREDYVGKKQGA